MIPRRPHNELLERLAETGPLGLAAFAAVFVTAIATALPDRARGARAGGLRQRASPTWRPWRRRPEPSRPASAVD